MYAAKYILSAAMIALCGGMAQDGVGDTDHARPAQFAAPTAPFLVQDALAPELRLRIAPAAFVFATDGALLLAAADSESAPATAGIVLRIEDRDNDGRFESSSIYASGLRQPTALQCWDRGVLIADAPDLLYAEDSNGDDRADRIETIFTGFHTDNAEASVSALVWGPDLRIHGPSNGMRCAVRRADAPGAEATMINGDAIIFNPLRRSLSASGANARRTIAFDTAGREYTLDRDGVPSLLIFPAARLAKRQHRLAVDPLQKLGDAPRARAVAIYDGDAWPAEYRGRLLLADDTTHEILCYAPVSEGSSVRLDQSTREVLLGGDQNIQTMQMELGPDGNIYVLDAAARIFRIAHANATPRPAQLPAALSRSETVPLLAHENGWHRRTAARILFAAQDRTLIPDLQRLAAEPGTPQARAAAMELLADLNALSTELLAAALDDQETALRIQAVRLSETALQRGAPEAISRRVRHLADDPDAAVRMQVAFALDALPLWDRIPALESLLRRDGQSHWLAAAIVALPSEGILPLISTILREHDFIARPEHEQVIETLAWHLGEAVETNADTHEVVSLLELLEQQQPEMGAALARVSALASSESNNPRLAQAIFAAETPRQDATRAAIENARELASNHDAPQALRIAAIRLLKYDEAGDAVTILSELLVPAAPFSIQQAALGTLTQLKDAEIAVRSIADAWPALGPQTRIAALTQLFARGDTLSPLLDAVAQGAIGMRAFDAGQVAQLVQHKNPELRARARELFKDYFGGPHADTVARFRPALQRPASFEHGRTLFIENCAKCHTFNGEGFRVGPDLAFMASAGADRLLKAILDPNAEVNMLYYSYTVETTDFQTITGIIAAEDDTSLLLRGPSGEENVISRDNIDTMSTFNQSLMPEGWDTAFGEQGIADLIAYLSLAAIRGR